MTKPYELHGYGKSRNPTYSRYQAMKQRCFNPKHKSYPDYGGRGITVCDRWRDSFAAFLADMGEAPLGHTIERDDTNGNYEPGNCKWADKQTQAENARSNIVVSVDGVEYPTLMAAATAYVLPYDTVRRRISAYGWSTERALKTPIDMAKRKKEKQT